MSVSIVINNYNYALYLGDAIRSALDQTLPALEVIVVDDGSTDDSRRVIESFGSRITAIFQDNGGQAAAFNTGIQAARGDWVWLLDADDSLTPTATEIASSLAGIGVARIAMGLNRIDASGKAIGRQLPNTGRAFEGTLLDIILEGGGLPSTPTSGNLFNREALIKILPVPTDAFPICADAYLFVMSAKHGKIKLDPSIVANYRIHGKNSFFRQDVNESDPVALGREINNVILTLKLLEDYCRTLSVRDSQKIRRFWMIDQVLLALLRGKLAGISNGFLNEWPISRLLFQSIVCLLKAPQACGTKYQKIRQLLKLIVVHYFALTKSKFSS